MFFIAGILLFLQGIANRWTCLILSRPQSTIGFPRINELASGSLKIPDMPRDRRQIMRQGRGRDKTVQKRPAIRHMQACAAQGHFFVHSQYPAEKCRPAPVCYEQGRIIRKPARLT
jgi:hypothetical protein